MHLDTAEMKDKQGAYYVSHYEGSSIHDSLLKIYAMKWTERDLLSMQFWGGHNQE